MHRDSIPGAFLQVTLSKCTGIQFPVYFCKALCRNAPGFNSRCFSAKMFVEMHREGRGINASPSLLPFTARESQLTGSCGRVTVPRGACHSMRRSPPVPLFPIPPRPQETAEILALCVPIGDFQSRCQMSCLYTLAPVLWSSRVAVKRQPGGRRPPTGSNEHEAPNHDAPTLRASKAVSDRTACD